MTINKSVNLRNLRSAVEYQYLFQKIDELHNGETVHFCPSPGNYGDALINVGSRQFFAAYNVETEELNRSEIRDRTNFAPERLENKLLIVGGGGGWCLNFPSTKEFVDEVAPFYDAVLVLPTTYELAPPAHGNVVCFARDRSISRANNPDAIFCHDMALYLELEVDILSEPLWRLYAFRGDHEGFGYQRYFKNNIDVSMLGGGSMTKILPFFTLIGTFQVVSTDRLHVAIAAAMLNKRVYLVDGNYSKNSGLFQSSLKKYADRVEILEFDQLLEKLFPQRTAEESRAYLNRPSNG